MSFWPDFFVISIIHLNNFFIIMLYRFCYKKNKNFCYICYAIVVYGKYKYSLLSLLNLKVTDIYVY
jgi:hypothetical protein